MLPAPERYAAAMPLPVVQIKKAASRPACFSLPLTAAKRVQREANSPGRLPQNDAMRASLYTKGRPAGNNTVSPTTVSTLTTNCFNYWAAHSYKPQ